MSFKTQRRIHSNNAARRAELEYGVLRLSLACRTILISRRIWIAGDGSARPVLVRRIIGRWICNVPLSFPLPLEY